MAALLSVLNKHMMNTSFKLNQKLYNLHVFIIITTVTVLYAHVYQMEYGKKEEKIYVKK